MDITCEAREHLDCSGAKSCCMDHALWVQAMQVLAYLAKHSMLLERVDKNGFVYYVVNIDDADVRNHVEWVFSSA